MHKILYIDDEEGNLLTFKFNFRKNYHIFTVQDPTKAIALIEKEGIRVIISDQRMPQLSGLELAAIIKQKFPLAIVIILTGFDDNKTLMQALNQGGIYRYILKPFEFSELKQTIDSALETHQLKSKNEELLNNLMKKNNELLKANKEIKILKNQLEEEVILLRDKITEAHNFPNIIGESKIMKQIFRQIELASKTDSNVLLLGESGTGKEIFANAIHSLSKRKHKILVKVNCAAIPENLIESELFGHEKGAFTGANKLKFGKIELANNGTLFLDELGELPINMQPKLLRVLQENEIERLGSTQVKKVNFRLIAATNRNLEEMIKEKKFREDLFYRINVLPITLPPLREHPEDIPLLIKYFIDKLNRERGKSVEEISKNDLKKLMQYKWPGNIRELENVIERAHVMCTHKKLTIGDWLRSDTEGFTAKEILPIEEAERQHILKALRHTQWKIWGKGGAAELLKINPSTLKSRIKKLGIKRPI